MRMRNRARALGILVELVEIDDPDPTPEARVTLSGRVRAPKVSAVAYRLPFPSPLVHAPAWKIVRRARTHDDAHPPGLAAWSWSTAPNALAQSADQYWRDVARVLAEAVEDAFLCEAGPRAVSLVWHERVVGNDAEGTVERLAESLRALADLQRLSHVARETELERQEHEGRHTSRPPS